MSVAKVTINGTTILDLTDATATSGSDVVSPKTAYSPTGTKLTGTAETVNNQTATRSYTPSETQQTDTITPDSSHTGLSSVGITVGAISSDYVGSGIDRRSSSDLTASGATVTVPSGYYEEQVTKSVASGTAGTPTATKGTVSNHSVSVTPSVTNTTGYINGGTQTGTAVTVSASELVSGNKAITQNGTGIDVTNYATVSVDVDTVNNQSKTKTYTPTKQTQSETVQPDSGYTGLSSVSVTVNPIPSNYIDTTDATATAADINSGATAYVNGSKVTGTQVIQVYRTGSSDPSSSLGNNGDIYLKVVS